MKTTFLGKLRDGVAVAAIVVMTAILLRSAVLAAGDRNRACVDNVFALHQGLAMYVQDYDQQYPIHMEDAAFVQSVVFPYLKKASLFRCPATQGTPYAYNAQLSGLALAAIPDPAATEEVRDSKAHPDGKFTVSFVSGRVERGGVVQPPPGPNPDISCVKYARQINLGLLMYIQDYDERLPTFSSDAEVKTVLLPYVKEAVKFQCPETLAFYHWNTAISGHVLAEYETPFTVETLRDAVLHKDKTVTKGFLDGHVKRGLP